MARVLKTKGGVDISQLSFVEQLYTFDTVARDPRGHCLSVTYMSLARGLAPKSSATTEHPQFFTVDALPKDLAYDHDEIIDYARRRLRRKITHTNTIYGLLPRLFTLSQLQQAYQAVLGRPLDKRNFRKKILGLHFIQPTDEFLMEGAHRPARLYKFNQQKLEYIGEDLG
jgi:8-oxo-dGTP diphosphatase